MSDIRMINIDTIAKHYVIAALWADCEEGTRPRATKQAQLQANFIAGKFAALVLPHWEALQECKEYGTHPDAGSIEAALGHDLWLTSCGHGVGFWSRDELTEDLQTALTAIVDKHFKEPSFEFYRGWFYLHPPAKRGIECQQG